MLGFLIRGLVAAGGLWVADQALTGISVDNWKTLLIAALLLGVVNAVVRPIVFFLTLPLTVITLGLFLFVVNGAMLGLVGMLLGGFQVDGFWAAVLGAIIIGLVSWVASWFIGGDGKVRSSKQD
jgi:putative membrane protein